MMMMRSRMAAALMPKASHKSESLMPMRPPKSHSSNFWRMPSREMRIKPPPNPEVYSTARAVS